MSASQKREFRITHMPRGFSPFFTGGNEEPFTEALSDLVVGRVYTDKTFGEAIGVARKKPDVRIVYRIVSRESGREQIYCPTVPIEPVSKGHAIGGTAFEEVSRKILRAVVASFNGEIARREARKAKRNEQGQIVWPSDYQLKTRLKSLDLRGLARELAVSEGSLRKHLKERKIVSGARKAKPVSR